MSVSTCDCDTPENPQKNLREREGDKYGRFMAKQAHEAARDERLNNLKMMRAEEGAKNSYKMMMKRKSIFEEAERKREEKRNSKLVILQDSCDASMPWPNSPGLNQLCAQTTPQPTTDVLEHHAEIEHRMMMHEMKKERYLEFKSELDALKEKNKEINVIRQRRKEDQRREDWATQVSRRRISPWCAGFSGPSRSSSCPLLRSVLLR